MGVIGIIVGVISGVVWEWLATSPFGGHSALFSSVIVQGSNKSFHIHHWIYYLLAFAVISIWAIKTGRFLHPAILMVLSFFVAAMLYNFWKFHDWYKFMS